MSASSGPAVTMSRNMEDNTRLLMAAVELGTVITVGIGGIKLDVAGVQVDQIQNDRNTEMQHVMIENDNFCRKVPNLINSLGFEMEVGY